MSEISKLVLGWGIVILQALIFLPELQNAELTVYIGIGMGWIATYIVKIIDMLQKGFTP